MNYFNSVHQNQLEHMHATNLVSPFLCPASFLQDKAAGKDVFTVLKAM